MGHVTNLRGAYESTKKSGGRIWTGADMSAKVVGMPPDFLVLSFKGPSSATRLQCALLILTEGTGMLTLMPRSLAARCRQNPDSC
jgi:hypothetical protein